MGSVDLWNIFEKSGSIEDYLNYTACTEEKQVQERGGGGEVAYGSSTGDSAWNGFVGDAGGGK